METWASIADQVRKHSSRRGVIVDTVVWHWSHGFGNAAALGHYVVNTARAASCSFAIGRAGEALQVTPLDRAAWHAGDGVGPLWDGARERMVNLRSIGIELCNWGPVTSEREVQHVVAGGGEIVEAQCRKRGFATWRRWERYPEVQLQAAREVVTRLRELLPTLRYCTGHEDITTGKCDPGPLFPWETMQCGLARCSRQWLRGMRAGQWTITQ